MNFNTTNNDNNELQYMNTTNKKRRFLNIPEGGISYIKELKDLEGIKSTNACVLMQYLEKRFQESPDGFYVQREPLQMSGLEPDDEDRRSLVEELGLTGNEIDTAFRQLGISYTKREAFYKARDKGDIFQGKYYCVRSRKTAFGRKSMFFNRDHEKVEEAIELLEGS